MQGTAQDEETGLYKKLLVPGTISVLIVLIFVMLFHVRQMQGDARVGNYAGIMRGATQRLVKQELTGHPNDELTRKLDGIITELQTGEGGNDLSALKIVNDELRHKTAELCPPPRENRKYPLLGL